MTIITYALIPITLLWVSYLLHKRGMKSNIVHLLDDSQFHIWENEQEEAYEDSFMVVGEPKLHIQPLHLLPQEKNNPTSEGEENEQAY